MPGQEIQADQRGRRVMAVSFEEVTRTTPERSLTVHLRGERAQTGRITVRHRGGGRPSSTG